MNIYQCAIYISIEFEFNIQTFTLQMGFRATIHILYSVFMQSWGRKVQRVENSGRGNVNGVGWGKMDFKLELELELEIGARS